MALNPTHMFGDALASCLPVHVLGLTLAPLSFSEETVKYTLVMCAVILFLNLIIALHGLKYRYGMWYSLSPAFAHGVKCCHPSPRVSCVH